MKIEYHILFIRCMNSYTYLASLCSNYQSMTFYLASPWYQTPKLKYCEDPKISLEVRVMETVTYLDALDQIGGAVSHILRWLHKVLLSYRVAGLWWSHSTYIAQGRSVLSHLCCCCQNLKWFHWELGTLLIKIENLPKPTYSHVGI